MRPKFEAQREFEFPTSNLKLTREYYAKYEAISKILDANPEIVDLAHRDLRQALIASNRSRPARVRFTTEHVLRLLIVQSLEGLSLRQTVVRVDDSPALAAVTVSPASPGGGETEAIAPSIPVGRAQESPARATTMTDSRQSLIRIEHTSSHTVAWDSRESLTSIEPGQAATHTPGPVTTRYPSLPQ